VKLLSATADDAADLVALHHASSEALTAQYGHGLWSAKVSEKGVLFMMRRSSVFLYRRRGRVVATLALSTTKPWAIDRKYFSSCARPLYLTSMAVHPDLQRQGIGRACLVEAVRIVRQWPGDAIRLDAWDAPAGAGEFYAKCGFREVGRAAYRAAPLIYYQMLL